MNYYHRFPGDYIKKTLDLSMVEDGAYTRLLDWMYANERAVPNEKRHTLTRCQTAAERKAVDMVLAQYFVLTDEGWTHERTAEAISEARPRIDAAKTNGKKGGRPLGSKNKPKEAPSDNPEKTQRVFIKNPEQTQSESSPYSIHQIQEIKGRATATVASRADSEIDTQGHEPTPAGLVCRAIRDAGLAETNPGDPRLIELIRQGATVPEFEGAAADAVHRGKGWAWMLAALAGKRRDAAAIALAPPVPSGPPWHETRSGIIAKGVELGLGGWDEAEWAAGRAPLFSAYSRKVFKAAGHGERSTA